MNLLQEAIEELLNSIKTSQLYNEYVVAIIDDEIILAPNFEHDQLTTL